MYAFSGDYTPPAPVLDVRIGKPRQPPLTGSLEALVDTGADGSFIPVSLIEQYDFPPFDLKTVRSQWGQAFPITTYSVSMTFNSHYFSFVEVIADETGNEIILGRIVLNRLSLAIDGIGSMTTIKEALAY